MTPDQRFTDNPILIVGSMAFDDLDLPTGSARDVVGGSATYAALAASLYSTSRIVAVVGDDFPKDTLVALEARGVDIAGLERAKGKTFRWAGRYAANLASRETLDTQLNVFADFRPKLPELYALPITGFQDRPSSSSIWQPRAHSSRCSRKPAPRSSSSPTR